MALVIHLLGAPRVVADGIELAPPRGRKAWALLTFLARSERPVPRDRLVSLLFADADDPYAALRWNLSALRRLLPGATIEGDPVRLRLPAGARVDAEILLSGAPDEAIGLGEIERELLEGLTFDRNAAFETWLLMERRHLQGAAEAVLREATLRRLAAGDAAAAAAYAGRLVRVDPYDEPSQVLLVRSLAAAGDGIAAARQAARCRELFVRERGVEPGPALDAAARTVTAAPYAGARRGRTGVRALIEAGEAAVRAGSLDAGLDCLYRAVADATAIADDPLRASALLTLGTTLVHAARGRSDEASTALHEVLAIAASGDLGSVAASAARELGYVEFLDARYDRSLVWLEKAEAFAGDDDAERCRIWSVTGSVLTDVARYDEAVSTLAAARDTAAAVGDGQRAAYAAAMLGRAHLLLGDLDAARTALDASLAGVEAERWTTFTPWPAALRGEVDLAGGEIAAAADRYEYAFALGCQIGDPCWEGIAARGLGLVAAAERRFDDAVQWFLDARARCRSRPDAYRWVDVASLDALCAVAVARRLPSAGGFVDELVRLASGFGMRELVVRAQLHRAALGDRDAPAAAELLAAEIASPALDRLVARAHRGR